MDAPSDEALNSRARSEVVRVFSAQAEVLQSLADETRQVQELATDTSESASLAEAQARRAAELARDGSGRIKRLESLETRLKEVDRSIGRLSERMSNIFHRVSVIEEIAIESNMLAINASIEAARAGEIGKGFSVVAESMRELSRQSRRAANEIAQVLAGGKEDIEAIGEAWSELRTDNGQVTSACLERFAETEQAVEEVSAQIAAIARSARAQSDKSESLADTALRSAEDQARVASELVGVITGEEIRNISPAKALELMGAATLIDVRRPNEWNDEFGHIEGAIMWTLGDPLNEALQSAPRGRKWIFVCRRGGRSMRACQKAMAAGLGEIYNLEGGMEAWNEAGLPVVRVH